MRKPLLNLRETSFNERMRPVPVVFLLLAFSPQLTVLVHVRCMFSCMEGRMCSGSDADVHVSGIVDRLFVGHDGIVGCIVIVVEE